MNYSAMSGDLSDDSTKMSDAIRPELSRLSSRPLYSIVIPWANRRELEFVLAWNNAIPFEYPVETIVVTAGGDWDELKALVKRAGASFIRLVNIHDSEFNKPLCMNIGVLSSRSEYIFLLDADILLSSDILRDAAGHLRSKACLVTVERVLEANPPSPDTAMSGKSIAPIRPFIARKRDTIEYVTKDSRRAILKRDTSPDSHDGDGLVLAKREHIIQVGGLNSGLRGWGYEDTDFQLRLQFQLGLAHAVVGEVVHLTHDRVKERKLWNQNVALCDFNYGRGHYLGSLNSDWDEWKDKIEECVIGEAHEDMVAPNLQSSARRQAWQPDNASPSGELGTMSRSILSMKLANSIRVYESPSGIVILDTNARTICTANRIAAHIWKGLIIGQKCTSEIVDSLLSEYEVARDVVEKDTVEFIHTLARREVLVA
jgi:glycosyltransferase involved in cell wall biosynthesis